MATFYTFCMYGMQSRVMYYVMHMCTCRGVYVTCISLVCRKGHYCNCEKIVACICTLPWRCTCAMVHTRLQFLAIQAFLISTSVMYSRFMQPCNSCHTMGGRYLGHGLVLHINYMSPCSYPRQRLPRYGNCCRVA